MYGFIGCGNMGGVLAAVAAKSVGGESILTADFDGAKLQKLKEQVGTIPSTTAEIAATCRFIVLGVKPQVVPAVAAEIRDVLSIRPDRFIVVSMAAGVPAAAVSELLGGCPVIEAQHSVCDGRPFRLNYGLRPFEAIILKIPDR